MTISGGVDGDRRHHCRTPQQTWSRSPNPRVLSRRTAPPCSLHPSPSGALPFRAVGRPFTTPPADISPRYPPSAVIYVTCLAVARIIARTIGESLYCGTKKPLLIKEYALRVWEA